MLGGYEPERGDLAASEGHSDGTPASLPQLQAGESAGDGDAAQPEQAGAPRCLRCETALEWNGEAWRCPACFERGGERAGLGKR